MTSDLHPLVSMNALIPRFRKVLKDFCDNGDYVLTLHFYQGGLRSPKIYDIEDKQSIKEELFDFLRFLNKSKFTGQMVFFLKHAEFTDNFNAFPGSGTLSPQKEGIRFKVVKFREHGDSWAYRIDNCGVV